MNEIDKINGFIGTDWSLDTISVEGVEIKILLMEERGFTATITCINYIGITYIGHWDESIIERIYVEACGELINASLQRIQALGNNATMNVGDTYYQLNIKMIDGNTVSVACTDFTFDLPSAI